MPEIKFKHIVSFSSEDKVHKAENLLKTETFRKWKCATPGEKQASVVVQLEKSSVIHSIDIGNENSAFVEVLVGRSVDTSLDFKVLLVASSFMSPMESKNGNNINRVRMFGPEKLASTVSSEKWDLVKIVCTQPFNKSIQYGLSFIKLHSPSSPVTEKIADAPPLKKLGSFSVKENDDDLSVGSWFAKRKENKPSVSTAAEIRDASTLAAVVLEQSSKLSKSLTPPKTKIIPKQNDDIRLSDQTEKTVDKNQPQNSVTKASSSNKTPLKRTDVEEDVKIKVPPLKKTKSSKSKPFHKLMEKVMFVLSGFQNPHRSELRDKALKMGAHYKGDWDKSCTHLVCAFTNTPKYDHVRKVGGRIVTKEWILDCYNKQSLLPWKDYMLGKYQRDSSSDGSDIESEVDSVQKTNAKKNHGNSDTRSKKSDIVGNTKERKKPDESTSKNILQLQGQKSDIGENGKETNESNESNPRGVPQSRVESIESEEEYAASTDVDENSSSSDNGSGQYTEKDLRKAYHSIKEAKMSPHKGEQKKPDTSDLPLPELPEFFKNKCFFLFGNFSSEEIHNLERYIIAFHGTTSQYMDDEVNFVVTKEAWDDRFNDALEENDQLIFVKPQWIYECNKKAKQIPYQRFVVVPSS